MTLTDDQRKAIAQMILFAWLGFAILLGFLGSFAMDEIEGIEGCRVAMVCFDGAIWTMMLLHACAWSSSSSRQKKEIKDLHLQTEELMERVKELEKSENNRA